MFRIHNLAPCLLAVVILACSQAAQARSSDRNKPMDINAGHSTGTLNKSTPTVLSGGVSIDQGTLHVESSKAVVTVGSGGIQMIVLTGGPVRLEQLLDDGTPMGAVAERVEYNMQTEIVVLIGNVRVKQPDNSLTSDRVVYNMRTGRVTSGGKDSGRVHMRIMPKGNGSNPSTGGARDGDGGTADGPAADAPVPVVDDAGSTGDTPEAG